MQNLKSLVSVIASIACGTALAWSADATAAESSTKPFRAYAAISTTHDDNVFRLENSAEAEQTLGKASLNDWYVSLAVGFESLIVQDSQAFELKADLFHQKYHEFSDFDYTGGKLRGAWNWKTSDAMRGDLGFRYRRNMRNFSNTNVPQNDIVDEYTAFTSIDWRLAQRWLLRIAPELTEFEFSASPQLDKQRIDLEAELQFAASQSNSFGLLTTYTQSSFDLGQALDFSGWSIGPSIRWQYTPNLKFTASVAYAHQGLDESQSDAQDFDGVTGFAVADFQSRETISWRLRVFRDISDLGGEVPRYTERTGVSLVPTWKITARLTGRAELTYEKRDFIASSEQVIDRKDEFFMGKLWLDRKIAERWLVSAGIGRESRTSNVQIQEFGDFTVYMTARLNF